MLFWKSPTQEKLDEILANQKSVIKNQVVLYRELKSIKKLINFLSLRLGPGKLTITIVGQKGDHMDIIQFEVNLPQKSALDVASRELSITIGGEEEIKTLDGDDLLVPDLQGPQDSTILLSLVDIDDAGNRSDPSTLEVVLVDTIPPRQPGSLGINITGEIHGEPEAPSDPEPEPEPGE